MPETNEINKLWKPMNGIKEEKAGDVNFQSVNMNPMQIRTFVFSME